VSRDSLVQLPPELDPFASSPPVRGARYLMGIDGGATKTLAAVLDVERGEVHVGRGESSNLDADGARKAGEALFGAAELALGRAGVEATELDAAVAAVAGTDTAAAAARVHAEHPRWIVVNDVVGAWATATDARPGVGAIAGTGSNVFGVGRVDGETRAWRTGGWGHLVGDEGSAYWVAVQAVRAVLHERDGSGPQAERLSGAVLECFGVQSVEAVAPLLFTKTKGEIAKFAIEVARAAEAGDPVALEIYMRAAREMANQITTVIHQTGLRGAFPVGLIGGAFKARAAYVDPLTAAIRSVAPEAQVTVVEMEPVGGVLKLAARACGAEDALAGIDLKGLIEQAPAAQS
jgi:glucosamine kinase